MESDSQASLSNSGQTASRNNQIASQYVLQQPAQEELPNPSRRKFLKTAAGLTAGGIASGLLIGVGAGMVYHGMTRSDQAPRNLVPTLKRIDHRAIPAISERSMRESYGLDVPISMPVGYHSAGVDMSNPEGTAYVLIQDPNTKEPKSIAAEYLGYTDNNNVYLRTVISNKW